jgi:hypothetical protein
MINIYKALRLRINKKISLIERFMVESSATFDKLPSVLKLKEHYETTLSKTHLRDLLTNEERNSHLRS